MKNPSSRILHKKKIYECYLSIHKSIGNILISNTNEGKFNQKYEIIKKKVSNKDLKQTLKEKNYLREKRLNNIFTNKKTNLYISQLNEDSQYNKFSKSKFAEKYKELYNLTTNNSKTKIREKNNSVNYYLSKLKIMNNENDLKEELKNCNVYNKDYVLKQTYNNLKNEITNSSNSLNKNYTNIKNLHSNIDKKMNNNNNIRKKLLNGKINGIRNNLKCFYKIKTENNKSNMLLNNYIQNNKISNKENYTNYFNISTSVKQNSCYPIYDQNKKTSYFKNNLFTNNNNMIFDRNPDKESFIHKVNHFKTRLNLVTMK